MAINNKTIQNIPRRPIEYVSLPAPVSMGDHWFEVASLDHFWVKRRFDVLKELTAGLIPRANEIAEVGCGHGLLQRQIETHYGKSVTGFDLNDYALRQNMSQISKICCYDIHRQEPAFLQRFDLVFLFDVLEHITDEKRFLDAVSLHLSPKGKLVINVPAGQWAYSTYDKAVGHVRRYSIRSLRAAALHSNLELETCTYWGFPLIPALVLRKLWQAKQEDPSKIISTGLGVESPLINRLMGLLCRLEFLPQSILGTSLLAVFNKQGAVG